MRNRCHIQRGDCRLSLCASLFFILSFSFCGSLRAQDSVRVVYLPDGQRLEMVWVEGGTFTMGSNRGVSANHRYEVNRPEHRVSVGSYYIGRVEVTQGVWRAVTGENPSKFAGNDSLPVEQVSWTDAQRFAALVSQLTGHRFRLPTEAEWEYAARGGNKARRTDFAGCDRGGLEHAAWFCVNSERCTHVVGRLAPNELGLRDMSGNVAEWCSDWMDAYGDGEQIDPRGPRTGSSRVLRGGHYNSVSAACSVYDRSWYVPAATSEYYGLRLVMEIDNTDDYED